MKRVGYARVSKAEPLDMVEEARGILERAGCPPSHIHVEQVGWREKEPAFSDAITTLRKGDVLVTPSLFRVVRSVSGLSNLLASLRGMGVDLEVLEEGLRTADPSNAPFFIAAEKLGALESKLNRDRRQEGIENAKAVGEFGRPASAQQKREQIIQMRQQGTSIEVIAKELEISSSSVYGILKKEAARIAEMGTQAKPAPLYIVWIAVSHNRPRGATQKEQRGAWAYSTSEEPKRVQLGDAVVANSETLFPAGLEEALSELIAGADDEAGVQIEVRVKNVGFEKYLTEHVPGWLPAGKAAFRKHDAGDVWRRFLALVSLGKITFVRATEESDRETLRLLQKRAATHAKG